MVLPRIILASSLLLWASLLVDVALAAESSLSAHGVVTMFAYPTR
jgi:hypothetical protein